MKKILGKLKEFVKNNKIGAAMITAAVIITGYFAITYFHSYQADILVATNPAKAVAKADTVNDSTWDLNLSATSSEEGIIQDMHEMTHQKVEADQKWGAIPMIPDTINQVYNVVDSSSFDYKDVLMEMLERWKKRDFSDIVADHNRLWTMQNGNIGEATGTATPEEEAKFILENFSTKLK